MRHPFLEHSTKFVLHYLSDFFPFIFVQRSYKVRVEDRKKEKNRSQKYSYTDEKVM